MALFTNDFGISTDYDNPNTSTLIDVNDGNTPGSFFDGIRSPSTNINADDLNAQISREQYQYYKDNFIPVERSMAGQIRDPREIEARSKNAGIRADKAYKSAKGSFDRNAGRFGIGLSADQRKEADKLFAMEGKAGIGGATTRARSDLYDINTQNRGEFVGLGRGIATGAQAGLSTAAANQAQTDAANQQIDAQQDASMLSTIGTIGMIAAMIPSSIDYKENIHDTSNKELADMVETMRIVEYDYKEDAPIHGHCLGVIAEESHPAFRNGEKQVNLYSMLGAVIGATQHLMERVKVLELENSELRGVKHG